ncbi:MAG TPA: phage tail sheath subtilisin-like domain-containing protein, partial [Pseudacidobacterium sp.]|nr:phage tail sheath subtilisin-like domain-containing protein [Pseudacidobacterium sp.]
QEAVSPATVTVGPVDFTAMEPIDLVPMTVTINNVQSVSYASDTADLQISYGSRGETYRKVNLKSTSDPNYIVNRINGVSQLITVAATPGSSFVAVGQAALQNPPSVQPSWKAFSPDDFVPVFQQDSSLDKVSIFNLLLVPGIADNGIWSEALAFSERKLAFVILDPPPQDSADGYGSMNLPLIGDDIQGPLVPKSTNGALYFPYLQSSDPLTANVLPYPPSGSVAGIYSATDNNRGVWKAPAGLETTILNTVGVVDTGEMTDARQGTLNPLGVNCLRDFPGIGTVVFGARTLVTENPAFVQWRYVPVRRMALFLEQTLKLNLTWVVFEPNDDPLWVAIRSSIESFMLSLFHQGAFQGSTPSQAFQVLCDSSTTTQQDIDNGIVNIFVAFAPLKPAEFVIIKIAQLAGQTQS